MKAPKPPPSSPLPQWVRRHLNKLTYDPQIFGRNHRSHRRGLKTAQWFYRHNSNRPHPVSHRPRYYCQANMWFISASLRIPLRSLQRYVRALEAHGFLKRLTIASKTGKYEINTWEIAHTPSARGQFYAKVLRGDVLLPPNEPQ